MLIRYFSSSYIGRFFAAATFHGLVSIWDVSSGKMISKFDTCFEFGGKRLSISPSGDHIVAASYSKKIIAAYDTSNGHQIWEYPAFSPPQGVTIDFKQKSGFFWSEDGRVNMFDTDTGQIADLKLEAKQLFILPLHSDIVALEKKNVLHLKNFVNSEDLGSIQKETFAILTISSNDAYLFLSESGGALRTISMKDYSEIWRNQPTKYWHFIKISYCEKNNLLFGILWHYGSGGEKTLMWFDPTSGSTIGTMSLQPVPAEVEFAMKGEILITSDGLIYDLNPSPPVLKSRLDFASM